MEKRNINSPEDFLNFNIDRNITTLFKEFLIIVEDLSEIFTISQDLKSKIRKKILDKGNDTIREIETCISKFNIDFK